MAERAQQPDEVWLETTIHSDLCSCHEPYNMRVDYTKNVFYFEVYCPKCNATKRFPVNKWVNRRISVLSPSTPIDPVEPTSPITHSKEFTPFDHALVKKYGIKLE